MSLILWTALAWGGGFELVQQSAAAGGTGHAGAARVDAASATANPAALADGAGWRGMVGLAVAHASIRASSPDFDTVTESGIATPPHLYLSGSHGRFAASVAANLAFAGGVAWAEDGPLRFESIASEPRFLRIAPAVAGRFGPVRLGVGMHIDRGYLSVQRATDHVAEEGLVDLALRGGGIGADASVWIDAGDVDLGLVYKGGSRLKLAGEADFTVPEAFETRFPDQEISAHWALPDRIVLGLSGTVDPITVLFDLGYTRWSVNQELVIAMSAENTDDVVQSNLWRDSLAVRAGAEARFGDWTARLGGYVDGLPKPPGPLATLAPSSPDSGRIGGTVGGGVGLGPVRVDAFGEGMGLMPRVSESLDAPVARYQGFAVFAGLGVELVPPMK